MIIIHGDDTVSARNHLNDIVETAKAKDEQVRRFEAVALDSTQLTQVLEALTLFGEEPSIIIEGLFALNKSKNKDNLITFLTDYQDRAIILFEDKSLSATVLKPFSKATVKEHKPAAIIFAFLDSLSPGNSSKCLALLTKLGQAGEPAELIFAMLVRQVRLLIQALEPNTLKAAPWQKSKLTSQARSFGSQALVSLHQNLYEIDRGVKTGKSTTDLSTQLFDLIANL